MPAPSLLSRFRRWRRFDAARARQEAIERVQAVAEFAADGILLDANDRFLALFGCGIDALRGRRHRDLIDMGATAGDDHAGFWSALVRGEARAGQFRYVAPDGRELWLQAGYTPVPDAAGRVARIAACVHDVTAPRRRQLDAAGRLAAIDRSMAVIEFDLDGIVLDANANFLATLGYARDEVVGRHHRMFVDDAAQRSDGYRAFWEALRAGTFRSGQFRRRRRDGGDVWLEATYNPILDAAGRPYRVVKFASDITAQRERDADSEGQLRAIHKVQAVIEFDLDGTVREANDHFLAAAGYTSEDVVGRHHRMFVRDDERESPAYRAFWDKLARGEPDAGQYRRRRADGSDLWLQASYNPVLDAGGRAYKVVKYCTDVTARVEQAEALKALVRRVDEIGQGIHRGAREIAGGNADLSRRTESQAAALQETAATMEQLADAIARTARNAQQADALVVQVDAATGSGRQAVERVAESMERIRAASCQVGEILGVIDAIAFQTSILALNAAVEAAHAGDRGRGFAVVATEVRALAQRCAASARDVKAMLAAADDAVAAGADRVGAADAAMRGIARAVGQTTRLIGDITSATREQTTGVQQVNEALQSMDGATQQNAALVETMASSSAELEGVARGLQNALATFQGREPAAA
ncbi:MAG TPA: PAS domain S-box protein [Lysobacter sp.]